MERQHRDEEEAIIWKSAPESVGSFTVGRAMTTLLSARPKKLRDAISRLCPDSKTASVGSLDESVWFIHRYVMDLAQREETMDEVLIPLIEHSLKSKDLKLRAQAIVIVDWFFQDEILFREVATSLVNIIVNREDRYVALGWCTLVRAVLEYESFTDMFPLSGIRGRFNDLLVVLCSRISRLLSIISNGSIVQDKFELPSRLAISAADCLISLSEALSKNSRMPGRKGKLFDSRTFDHPVSLMPPGTGEQDEKVGGRFNEQDVETGLLLSDHIDDLINLVQKLVAWSKRSRTLHAKGLELVLKWLDEMRDQYGAVRKEAVSKNLMSGNQLLSSCWKNYGMLMHLEDQKILKNHKESLEKYMSGIQYFTDTSAKADIGDKDGSIGMRKLFLTCLCLLLGRFSGEKLDSVLLEYGTQISHIILSQREHSGHVETMYLVALPIFSLEGVLKWVFPGNFKVGLSGGLDFVEALQSVLDKCFNNHEFAEFGDEGLIDGSVSILKLIIFRKNHTSASDQTDTREMDALLLLLLQFLDERDGAARAVVILIAECCYINADGHYLDEIFSRLASENTIQRRNAVDVLSELIHILKYKASESSLSDSLWQDISNHLLELLHDDESSIQEQAINLLPLINPSVVLPALVQLVDSSDERAQLSARHSLIILLKYHNQNPEVICLLLDILSSHHTKTLGDLGCSNSAGKGVNLDGDQVLKLIPEWSTSVQDWNPLIEPLLDKMFAEPSNATIVRFLSYIGEHFANAAELVLQRVLLQLKRQALMSNDSISRLDTRTSSTRDEHLKIQQQSLFERLCPLLIIRLLPLRVFSNSNLFVMYGQLPDQEHRDRSDLADDCIAAILLKRAFCDFEYEDVRKLAAELCGRFHPQVLLPIILSQIKCAAASQDVTRVKACLFSVCTSLVARGKDTLLHPLILEIRTTTEKVLLWPSTIGDEVSRAQHGCIDCLALMVCAELQGNESLEVVTLLDSGIGAANGGDALRSPVRYVFHHLIHGEHKLLSTANLSGKECQIESQNALSFRLCMANVLISACQKIHDMNKISFAEKIIPRLICSIEAVDRPEIRAACMQVLFSAVYNLKSVVLPYSSDLFKLSLEFLRVKSEKERLAGAKLMASLMACDDAILVNISGGLLEARSILSTVCSTDPSSDVRQVCKQLLACLSI